MSRHFKRIAILTLGVLFVLLGIIGLVLPFLQGFLFLFIGILLLSLYMPSLREWIERRTKPYPKVYAFVVKADQWIEKIIGRP